MTSFDFLLPDVGEGIAEAEIIEWLVNVGDQVTVDQPVAIMETDKSQIEMPTPVAGRVAALGGKPGDLLNVGAVVVTIEVHDQQSATSEPAPDSMRINSAQAIMSGSAASRYRMNSASKATRTPTPDCMH